MPSGDSFMGPSSTADPVQSTREATSSAQEGLRAARKDPEKTLGIPREEIERRQQEARKPRQFVSDETRRKFEVKSSARAQQILQQGIDKFQREKRRKDLKKSMAVLRKVQVLLCIFGVGFFFWIGTTYLLPQYAAVQNRNRLMQLRYERAQQKLAESGAVAGGAGARDGAALHPTGPVMRVFRVDEDEASQAKHSIQ